jgi:hypothetical protein
MRMVIIIHRIKPEVEVEATAEEAIRAEVAVEVDSAEAKVEDRVQ